ncbi:MAG TPA: cupin domain-containing protein [Anaerovoracaceae bacterium]|nr:cupin domain-containing protein [Anaerovoracaceae bacterium]
MIKRKEEMYSEIKTEVRGGKGTMGISYLLSQEESFTAKLDKMARVNLAPGCSIGVHPHDITEEIYYILQGKALFHDNGEVKQLQPGDATITGGGETHSIESLGPETLDMVAVIIKK